MSDEGEGRQGRALRFLAFLAFLTIAYFAGVATERMRFDRERSAVIQKYEKALADWKNQQMKAEKSAEKTPPR
jgi:hypothetical protein